MRTWPNVHGVTSFCNECIVLYGFYNVLCVLMCVRACADDVCFSTIRSRKTISPKLLSINFIKNILYVRPHRYTHITLYKCIYYVIVIIIIINML